MLISTVEQWSSTAKYSRCTRLIPFIDWARTERFTDQKKQIHQLKYVCKLEILHLTHFYSQIKTKRQQVSLIVAGRAHAAKVLPYVEHHSDDPRFDR